jgi:hypothetical protein
MALVEINPRYGELLQRQGLADAERLLDLPGVIVCGHPGRQVLQVRLQLESEWTVPEASPPDRSYETRDRHVLPCYLKREHRVTWLARLANAWAGFGFVSGSRREAQMLQELRQAGVGCPDWIAAGEDDRGRAFLLLRDLDKSLDLRRYLQAQGDASHSGRRSMAQRLGTTLAQLHDAGFHHLDLYAKHVLVDPRDASIHILDWQRARRRRFVGWPARWHDLATLHATLAGDLAGPRDRLACLHAYLRTTLAGPPPRHFRLAAARWIDNLARRLLRRRTVREQRQSQSPIGSQRLIWMDGEALCVTPEFHAAVQGRVPAWLTTSPGRKGVEFLTVDVPGAPHAHFVSRDRSDWFRWLWCRLRGKPFVSLELRRLGLIHRLQRYGIVTPRVLAFGQRFPRPWHISSFLLTEPPPDTIGLAEWLGQNPNKRAQRWVFRQAAGLLRGLHDAGCIPGGKPAAQMFGVQTCGGQPFRIVLTDMESLRTTDIGWRQVRRDLQALQQSVAGPAWSRTDSLRLVLAYLGKARLDQQGRRLARAVIFQLRRDCT